MKITRIDEKPRVTFPFSDEAWTALDALGDRVDADLTAQDVRLTMGGEPTFVSVDDYQAAEWNTAALGPTKRVLADQLIRRLRDRFAPGGLLHYGQGKWYPGEPLPRWAFSLFWRKDGKPIWQNAALIATEEAARNAVERRRASLHRSAGRAGSASPPTHVLPAFEDPADRMLKEGALPPNVDPADPKIDDPIERARIMREFERHLSAPTGYVLPVQRWSAQASAGWISELWQLRRRRLFLVPGDSPIGFRLPLNSLPYVAPIDEPHLVPADPFADRGALPDPAAVAQGLPPVTAFAAPPLMAGLEARRRAGRDDRTSIRPAGAHRARRSSRATAGSACSCRRSSGWRIISSCSPRSRRPPPSSTCRSMSKAIRRRPIRACNVIKVTPDPGVIEVNIHPAASWREAVDITRSALRGGAAQCRLGTDKFMIDGRHTGTGGGNHVVLGGADARPTARSCAGPICSRA